MANVERTKRSNWTSQRVSSIIILCLASLGFVYSFNQGLGYLKARQENKDLLKQKQELLAEYEMYHSLIEDHDAKVIIQDRGYCYDPSSNSFYKCN
ncbi:MAG: hypothetical protein E7184_01165 [Erysipelotrichaceae bacterium]|nr:hypothetical protein [Erysipelotrichaceae bacterium]